MLRNDILALLKELKLHGLRGAYDEMLEHGRRSGATLERFLLDLLKAEQAERRVRSIRYRLGIARFPVSKDLDGFDFQDSHVGEARIRDLYQGGFMESWINVVFVGGTGTGKNAFKHRHRLQCRAQRRPSALFQSGGPRQPARAGKGGRQGRTAGRDFGALRLGHPGRTRLPAVFQVRRPAALSPALKALREDLGADHHEPELRGVVTGLWRRQDDHGPVGPRPHITARSSKQAMKAGG